MIESYNASKDTCIERLVDECEVINPLNEYISKEEYLKHIHKYILKGSDDHSKYLTRKDFGIIIDSLQNILKEDYPKLTNVRRYLKDIGKICNALDVTIPWTLPSGLVVDQGYLLSRSDKIQPFTYNKKSFTITVVDKNKLNHKKQIRALMPNLVHSLDATSLRMLYKKYRVKYKNIYTVHDCFGVPIPMVSVLRDL